MKKTAAQTTTEVPAKKPSAEIDGWKIGVQFMDTTWRVAVPIVTFCYIGIQLDKHYHTNPRYTLVGLFSSLALATYLVYYQVRQAYPDFFKKAGRK